MSTELTPFQVEALVLHAEMLADTFNGSINGSLVDAFKKESTQDAFRPLIVEAVTSTQDPQLIEAAFMFDHEFPVRFGNQTVDSVALALPLDEDNSIHFIYCILENGERMTTFSHDGLTLTTHSGWGTFDQTGFTTIRDNTEPDQHYLVSKLLETFTAHPELDIVKNYAFLTWNNEGIGNRVLSDIKTLCSFVEIIHPESAAEKTSHQFLPNGLGRWELLDVAVADALCDEITDAIAKQDVFMDVTESDVHGFTGCRISYKLGQWGKGFKQGNLFLEICSGSSDKDASLSLYSANEAESYVEINVNHISRFEPLVYREHHMLEAFGKASDGDKSEEERLIMGVLDKVKAFKDYFVDPSGPDALVAAALIQTLQNRLSQLEAT